MIDGKHFQGSGDAWFKEPGLIKTTTLDDLAIFFRGSKSGNSSVLPLAKPFNEITLITNTEYFVYCYNLIRVHTTGGVSTPTIIAETHYYLPYLRQ